MLTQELQTGFSDLALRNLDRWLSDQVLKRLAMTAESAAYATLENAGVLWRSNPENSSLVRLNSLPKEVLRRLPLDACRYAKDFSIPDPVLGLLSRDLLEPEDIERCEHVFEQIDGLDAVIDLAAELLREQLETDDELLIALAKSRQNVAGLLDKFADRADIAEVASRAVLTQRDPVFLPDGRPADWFTSVRQQDETNSLESIVLALQLGPGNIPAIKAGHQVRPLESLVQHSETVRSETINYRVAADQPNVQDTSEVELNSLQSSVEGDAFVGIREPDKDDRPHLRVSVHHSQ